MALRTAAPGEGGGGGSIVYRFTGTLPGPKGQWHAYSAGPCYWCVAHTKGKSQVCLQWVTGGELPCPRCNPMDPKEEIGYQPVYDEVATVPRMVIVHATVREVVDGIGFHRRVLIGRNEGAAEGVWVVPALNPNPKFTSTLQYKNRHADLTPTLLAVWRYPELREWYKRTGGASDNAVSTTVTAPPVALPKGKAKRGNGKPFSPMNQAAAKRAGVEVEKEEYSDKTFDEVKEKLKARFGLNGQSPSNGDHKPE